MLIIHPNGSATLKDCCHTIRHSVSADCIVSRNLKRVSLADGGNSQKHECESSIIMCCHTEKLGFVFPYKGNVKYKAFHLFVSRKALLSPSVAPLWSHSHDKSNKHKKYWIHWMCKQWYQGKVTMKHSNFPFSVSFPPVCASARAGLQSCMWMLSFFCVLCFSVSH